MERAKWWCRQWATECTPWDEGNFVFEVALAELERTTEWQMLLSGFSFRAVVFQVASDCC